MATSSSILQRAAGPTLQASHLADFERRWQVVLPEDYRAWLLTNNGGVPVSQVVKTDAGEVFVSFFFDLDPKGDRGLDSELRRLDAQGTLLPIALEGGGKTICLSLADGNVLLIEDLSQSATPGGVERLACSWSQFLSGFATHEMPSETLDDLLVRIARDTDEPALAAFLATGGSIHQTNSSGETMFHLAVLKKNTGSMQLLLKHGASMNGALHMAARVAAVPMIEWLLQNGASLDELNEQGLRADEVASMPFVKRLLQGKRSR